MISRQRTGTQALTICWPDYKLTSFGTGINAGTITVNLSGTGISNTFFERDEEQRIWFSPADAIQKLGGYNDSYDLIFDGLGAIHLTENSHWKSEFIYGEYEYRIEAWKGNYLWMGVGAELGLYYRPRMIKHSLEQPVNGHGYMNVYQCGGHFFVLPDKPVPTDKDLFSWREFTLEISLYYQPDLKKKELIFKRDAQQHWWINGFRPNIGKIDPSKLTLEGSIIFPEKRMAEAFKGGLQEKDKKLLKAHQLMGKRLLLAGPERDIHAIFQKNTYFSGLIAILRPMEHLREEFK